MGEGEEEGEQDKQANRKVRAEEQAQSGLVMAAAVVLSPAE